MATHVSVAAAAVNLISLLARVEAGEEILIEEGTRAVAVLRRPDFPRRSISETIARAEANAKIRGYTPVMDADFAADVEERIRNRKPRDTSAWD